VTKTEITEKKDTSKYKEIVQWLKSQSIFTLLNFLWKK
jgi:hypothetical protein